MPAHTPRSIVEAFYAAEDHYLADPENRDLAPVAACMSPTTKMNQSQALPWGGIFVGPAGLEAWSKKIYKLFSAFTGRDRRWFVGEEGSGRIVTTTTVTVTVRSTGEQLEFPFCQTWLTDLEKGVVLEIYPFYWDVDGLNRALGHDPRK